MQESAWLRHEVARLTQAHADMQYALFFDGVSIAGRLGAMCRAHRDAVPVFEVRALAEEIVASVTTGTPHNKKRPLLCEQDTEFPAAKRCCSIRGSNP
jgi:hypothetical protein